MLHFPRFFIVSSCPSCECFCGAVALLITMIATGNDAGFILFLCLFEMMIYDVAVFNSGLSDLRPGARRFAGPLFRPGVQHFDGPGLLIPPNASAQAQRGLTSRPKPNRASSLCFCRPPSLLLPPPPSFSTGPSTRRRPPLPRPRRRGRPAPPLLWPVCDRFLGFSPYTLLPRNGFCLPLSCAAEY